MSVTKAWVEVCGCFHKMLSLAGKKYIHWRFITRQYRGEVNFRLPWPKSRWMGGVGRGLLSHLARRLHC